MFPTVRPGEPVVIRPLTRLRAGAVVLTESGDPGGCVLHRVAMVLPGGRRFVHTGDANPWNSATASVLEIVIGEADLAWRRPRLTERLAAARCVGRAALRRVRVS